jgi:hypothetical protein
MRTWLHEHQNREQSTDTPEQAPSMEQARLQEAVAQLLPMLENNDLDALEVWKVIHAPLGEELPDFIGRINTYMKNLEFEMAGRHLRHWLDKQKDPSSAESSTPEGSAS